MLRAAFGEVLLFFVPFAVFALYLLWKRRSLLHFAHWNDQAIWLVIAGLACVSAAFIYSGVMAERHTGAFSPTRLENGKVVPGQFQ
jgi:hypothetical protein